MTKKHFIDLADTLRQCRSDRKLLGDVADFCKRMNNNFNKQRWLDYIDGKCG